MSGEASGSSMRVNFTTAKKLKEDTVRRKRLKLKMQHLKYNPNDFNFLGLTMLPELSDVTRQTDNSITSNVTSTDTADTIGLIENVSHMTRHVGESTCQHSVEMHPSHFPMDILDSGDDDDENNEDGDDVATVHNYDTETDNFHLPRWSIEGEERELTEEESTEEEEEAESTEDPTEEEEGESTEEPTEEDRKDEDGANSTVVSDVNGVSDNIFALTKGVLSQKLVMKPNVTLQDAVARVIAVSIRSNWTYVSILDSLRVLASMTLNSSIPKSINGLWSLLSRNDREISTRHYYCETCLDVMGTNKGALKECCCKKYGPTTKRKDIPYFIQVSLASQLRQLLQTPTMYESLQYRHTRNKENIDDVQDMYDGKEYKTMSEPHSFLDNVNNFSLTLNTDGCSVAKSSNASAWPILMQINELPPHARKRNILLGGIWVDKVHPNLNKLLTPTMKELKELYNIGVQWRNPIDGAEITSKFVTLACSVDTPARSDILNMTRFNGEYGCTFCYAPGERTVGKGPGRVYPLSRGNEYKRRSDTYLRKYMRQTYEDNSNKRKFGVKGASPLMLLPQFNLSSGIIVESMHNLYLGVVKLHTTLLINGKSTDPWYIGTPTVISVIDDQLMQIQRPSKISRAPRSLKEIKQWKANEWRNWILYYAVICLKGKMHLNHVNLLSLLSKAAYIYSKDCISVQELKEARSLINDYVKKFQSTFGAANMKFNVHLLTHLPETVENWGPLWAHSAFPFESWNKKIIDSVTSANARQLQIVTRHMMSTFIERLLYDPSVQADTKKTITSILYGGAKKAARRDHHNRNDNVFNFQGKGKHQTRSPSAWESQALQAVGIDNTTQLTCYCSASIHGLRYESRNNTSKTEKKRCCDEYIYCHLGFARIINIVQFSHNNQMIHGFFVQLMTCLGAVANVQHIQSIEPSTDKHFIRIGNEAPIPAIRISSNSGDCIVKLANVWESD